ncbi:MAG: emopamil-binding family protein [Bacteroidota bacterium]
MSTFTSIPLRQRKVDWPILGFFWLNILVITYMIDLEQLVIADPYDFDYPLWPPRFIIDAVHWWGSNFDPVLMERPMWWKMTIWIDQLFFGPFYIFAIWAYTKGKNWIRIPSIIYASVMMTNVTIILGEEIWGTHPTPALGIVLFANASWFLMPVYILWRMWKHEKPFTVPRLS